MAVADQERVRTLPMSQQQQPFNDSEWMLYRVLQRANLVQYFDMFTAQGGDDVYQLCEAGEEEFLEIMALVGMAGKPLHVRRLQKALHEWLTNPASFKTSEDVRPVIFPPAKGSILASVPQSVSQASCRFWMNSAHMRGQMLSALPEDFRGFPDESISPGKRETNGVNSFSRKGFLSSSVDVELNVISDRTVNTSPSPSMMSTGCQSDVPLTEAQIRALEICAAELSKTLPLYASRPLNVKKPVDKEIEEVLNYPEDYPNRMDLLRKYSAIYGRFDSKRKTDKQMNFHEMCVNEAAAQLCRHRPSLLTRREDLFSLARQVVREGGFQCSKGHSRARDNISAELVPPNKRMKVETSQSSPSSRPSSSGQYMRSTSTPFLEGLDQEDLLNARTALLSGNRDDEGGVDKSGSLVDEGLRIAQQYGLGEFAEELRGLKRETMDYKETVDEEEVEDEEEEDEEGEEDGGENNLSCGDDRKQTSFNSVTGECRS